MLIKLENKNSGVTISNISENGIVVVNQGKLEKIDTIGSNQLSRELKTQLSTVISMQLTVDTLTTEISTLTSTINSLTN